MNLTVLFVFVLAPMLLWSMIMPCVAFRFVHGCGYSKISVQDGDANGGSDEDAIAIIDCSNYYSDLNKQRTLFQKMASMIATNCNYTMFGPIRELRVYMHTILKHALYAGYGLYDCSAYDDTAKNLANCFATYDDQPMERLCDLCADEYKKFFSAVGCPVDDPNMCTISCCCKLLTVWEYVSFAVFCISTAILTFMYVEIKHRLVTNKKNGNDQNQICLFVAENDDDLAWEDTDGEDFKEEHDSVIEDDVHDEKEYTCTVTGTKVAFRIKTSNVVESEEQPVDPDDDDSISESSNDTVYNDVSDE